MGRKNSRNSSFTLASESYKGFTLVELLIVVSIIVILAVIALLYLRGQLFKGNDAKRKGDITRISVAVEEYEKDHNCYPTADKMTLCGSDPSIAVNPYLNNVPCDPITKKPYYYDTDNSSGSCPKWFRLSAKLENTADPLANGYCGPGGLNNFYQGSSNAPNCKYIQVANGMYGCKNGVCVPLLKDNSKNNKWECYPIYGDIDCNQACTPGKCIPSN